MIVNMYTKVVHDRRRQPVSVHINKHICMHKIVRIQVKSIVYTCIILTYLLFLSSPVPVPRVTAVQPFQSSSP